MACGLNCASFCRRIKSIPYPPVCDIHGLGVCDLAASESALETRHAAPAPLINPPPVIMPVPAAQSFLYDPPVPQMRRPDLAMRARRRPMQIRRRIPVEINQGCCKRPALIFGDK